MATTLNDAMPHRSSRPRMSFVVAVMIAFGIGILLLRAAGELVFFSISESLSSPVFVADAQALDRGVHVVLWTPESAHGGRRQNIKRIGAMPGDVLVVDGRTIRLPDGTELSVKPVSLSGVPLHVNAETVVPADHVFVIGDHIDSYDSRYASVGMVHFDNLGRTVRPLF